MLRLKARPTHPQEHFAPPIYGAGWLGWLPNYKHLAPTERSWVFPGYNVHTITIHEPTRN